MDSLYTTILNRLFGTLSFFVLALISNVNAQDCQLISITCTTDTVFCNDPRADVGYIPGEEDEPLIESMSCAPGEITLQYEPYWPDSIYSDCDSDFSYRLTRNWKAFTKDDTLTCQDTIYVWNLNVDEPSLLCCEGIDTFYCDQLSPEELDEDGVPLPEFTCVPQYILPGNIDTVDIWPDSDLCKGFVDVEYDIWPDVCGPGKLIERTWTIKNSCSEILNCVDTIVIVDTTQLRIAFDEHVDMDTFMTMNLNGIYATDTFHTVGNECTGSGYLPLPDAIQQCADAGITITIHSSSFHIDIPPYDPSEELPDNFVSGVPGGMNHIIVYKAVDECWRTTMDTLVLVVVDHTPAVSACHDEINLTLLNVEDNTWMKAESLDADSYDNCNGQITFYARRTDWQTACDYENEDSPVRQYHEEFRQWLAIDGFCDTSHIPEGFADKVPFCCADVGNGPIMVELLIVDVNCNVDMCWGMVTVEDKLAPQLKSSLPDVEVTCQGFKTFYEDIVIARDTAAIRAAFGEYVFEEPFKEDWVLMDIECGTGDTLTETYKDGLLKDQCNSELREEYELDQENCGTGTFTRRFIATVSGKTGPEDVLIDEQTISIIPCELNNLSIMWPPEEVEVFGCGVEYGNDGNVAIETEGFMIDGLDDCNNLGVGYYDKVFNIVSGEGCAKVIRTWCLLDWCNIDLNDLATWETISKMDDVLTYRQTIKIIDTVPPDVSLNQNFELISTTNCQASVNASISVVDNGCGQTDFDVTWRLLEGGSVVASGEGMVANPSQLLDPGDYGIVWTATDNCGNSSSISQAFSVASEKIPSVVGISIITAELTPMDTTGDNTIDVGMAEVIASQFDLSSAAACGGSEDDLIYLIQKGQSEMEPENDATSITLTCEDFTGNPTAIPATFWVKDTANQTAGFINVVIMLEDNMGACESGSTAASISGKIITERQERVHDVTVTAINSMGESSSTTSQSGEFEIETVMEPTTLIPIKDGDDGDGLSTIDLIKIQKQILGIQRLSSPYKMIAADVNVDGKINASDMVIIRQLILGKISAFPDINSWRFVDAEHGFVSANQALMYEFPEHIQVLIDQYTKKSDFVGVKMGDIDGDVMRVKKSRSNRTIDILAVSNKLSDDQVEWTLSIPESHDLEGSQIGLQFADAMPIDIRDAFGEFAEETIHLSEINGKPTLKAIHIGNIKDNILSFRLPATNAQSPFELLDHFKSEVYTANGEKLAIRVQIVRDDDHSEMNITLGQNYPNPFRVATTIPFKLSQGDLVQLQITDLTGRVVMQRTESFEAGFNEFILDSERLPQGVLVYTISTSTFSESKRMTKLN